MFVLLSYWMFDWLTDFYSVQEESKTNAGSVEAIQEHPDDSNKVSRQTMTFGTLYNCAASIAWDLFHWKYKSK